MKSHIHKKNRKKRIEKRIKKRGYLSAKLIKKAEERAKEAKVEEKVEERKEVEAVEAKEEIDLTPFREFVNKRAKGKKMVRFKITTLARELQIDVEEARKLAEAAGVKIKGDRVTVRLNE